MKTLILIFLINLSTVVCFSQNFQESFTVIRADDLNRSGSIFNLQFDSFSTHGELRFIQEDFEMLSIEVISSDGNSVTSMIAEFGVNHVDLSNLVNDVYSVHVKSITNDTEEECYSLIRLGNKQNSVAAIEGFNGGR